MQIKRLIAYKLPYNWLKLKTELMVLANLKRYLEKKMYS